MLILEACHGGFGDGNWKTEVEAFAESDHRPDFLRPFLPEEPINGLYVLTSTSTNEKGHEGSHFTELVVDTLGGRGQVTEDGYVTASLLVQQICTLMPRPPSCGQWSMVGSRDFPLSSEPVSVEGVHASQIDRITDSMIDESTKELKNLLDMIESGIRLCEHVLYNPNNSEAHEISQSVDKLFKSVIIEHDGNTLRIKEGNVDYMMPARISEYFRQWDRIKNDIGILSSGIMNRKLDTISTTLARQKVQLDVLEPPLLPAEQTCLGREQEVAALLEKLESKEGSIVGIIGVHGIGGIGKTVLAYHVFHNELVRARFRDGCFWITAGEEENAAAILDDQTSLYRQLSKDSEARFASSDKAQTALEAIVRDKSCLIVLDDVWNPRVCERFGCNVLASVRKPDSMAAAKFLVTTRDSKLFGVRQIGMYELNCLNRNEAITLLSHESRIDVNELLKTPNSDSLSALLKQCGEPPIPLVVSVVGGMLGETAEEEEDVEICLDEVFRVIDETGIVDQPVPGDRNKTLSTVLMSSLSVLVSDKKYSRFNPKELFLDMSVFPEDCNIAVSLVEWVWSLRGVPFAVCKELIRKLCRLSLLKRNTVGGQSIVKLHDSVRSFAQSTVKGIEHNEEHLRRRHKFLVESYGRICGRKDANHNIAWWKGGPNESVNEYMRQHLTYHLNEAQSYEAIFAVVTDLDWIIYRGIVGVMFEDCRYLSEVDDIRLLQSALELSMDAYLKHPVKEELAFQLFERLRTCSERLSQFLAELRNSSCVEVVHGVLEAAGGPLLRIMTGHTRWVTSVAVTSDGNHAISGSADNTVRVWNLRTGECESVLEGHTDWVNSVAVTSDGNHAISGSEDNTVRVWDLRTGECESVLEGHTKDVISVAVTSDGNHALSGSGDNTVRVWDLRTGECESVLKGHTDWVNSVAVTSDGNHTISGSRDRSVRVWDLRTGECESVLKGHTGMVNSVAFTSDGNHAISGSNDSSVRVWDLRTGECELVLEGHTEDVNSVAVTSDGNHAISGSWDNTVRVWDLRTGECESVLEGHTEDVTSVTVTSDGNHAISGSYDKTVRVWDLRTGGCESILKGHTNFVTSVAVTSDRNHAISGSWDNTVRVWDLRTGECESILKGHTHWVTSVAVTSDRNHAISGSEDKTVRVWDLRTGECTWMRCFDNLPSCLSFASNVLVVGNGYKVGILKVKSLEKELAGGRR